MTNFEHHNEDDFRAFAVGVVLGVSSIILAYVLIG